MKDNIMVFSIKGDAFKGLEEDTAQRVMKYLLSHEKGRLFTVFDVDRDQALTVKDLYTHGRYDVYIVIKGIVFITHSNINRLYDIVLNKKDFFAVAPVCNESKVAEQKYAPPYLYQTVSVFQWAAEAIYGKYSDEVISVDEIDDFCFAFGRKLLDTLPEDYKLIDLPNVGKKSGLRFGIAKGVYTHRYGNVYESAREDLLVHVPPDAQSVLDIGCAKGLFGAFLKKRQKCTVTGIDSDPTLINISRERLDNVICGNIEEIIDKGSLGVFDCIVCGDLVEHLNNPWKVVAKLKGYLRRGGIFVASTPNILNWAIIYEMLNGRWDYVPFSILSGTHIRFFTKQTFRELFEEAGYRIKEIYLQSFDMPSQGLEFIGKMKKHMVSIDEEELRASEIVLVAEN